MVMGSHVLSAGGVLRDENGTEALLDLDFENSRYRYAGVTYSTFTALASAVGAGTDNGDGTYTLGPVSNAPFAGYNAAEGTFVSEYVKTGTTQSTFVFSINPAGDNTKYVRKLSLSATNIADFTVFRSNVAQAAFFSPAGSLQQQNYRFRSCGVMKTNDFSEHVNGELMGVDTSGSPSDAATNVTLYLGHRGGSGKLDGTLYRFTYFPRAVSSDRRVALSFYEQGLVAGGRTFFNTPNAIKINDEIWASAVSQQLGKTVIGALGKGPIQMGTAVQRDDHNEGAFLRRSSDGRILHAYALHTVDNNYYISLSTNPDDMTAWGAPTNIAASIGATQTAYAQLIEITEGIFLFFRCVNSGIAYYTWHYTKSTDGGATWSTVQQLFAENGQRSYTQVAKTGANRIDVICNNGHPDEYPAGGPAKNSTYHCYYDGSWHKSDGTAFTPPIIPSTGLSSGSSRIWDGTLGVESWVWWVGGTAPNPVAVYATFPNRVNDHRYRYARWNGASWDDNQVCTAGGTLYDVVNGTFGTDSSVTQDHYSGGITIDDVNPNIIYCSRPTKSDGTIGVGGPVGATRGVFQIWKGVTSDNGATWTMTQLTFGTEDCYRPRKVAGSGVLVFCKGKYVKFTNYQVRVASIGV